MPHFLEIFQSTTRNVCPDVEQTASEAVRVLRIVFFPTVFLSNLTPVLNRVNAVTR